MAGLYLHIPYCTRRCTYCDFYFVTTRKSHASFVEALCSEIRLYATEYAHREPVRTIYFGGGTPSRLLPDEIARILSTIGDAFGLTDLEEMTFEVNPEDVNKDYLKALIQLGITRPSIGIQSFYASDLTFMGRVHDETQARRAISTVQKAGFPSFSIDLIFGIPDQPREYWAANLEIAARLNIPHISTYGLTIEDRTPLGKQVKTGVVEPVDEETGAELFRFTMDYLESRSMEHYEISSFALPGHRSIHNHRYWSHENYIGLGPGAHSFWWTGLPARRWSNVRNLTRYEAFLGGRTRPIDAQEALSLDVLAGEYIMLALRTSDGVDLDVLESRYGVDLLSEKLDELAYLESSGLVKPLQNQNLRLTNEGKILCNSVTERLLPDRN